MLRRSISERDEKNANRNDLQPETVSISPTIRLYCLCEHLCEFSANDLLGAYLKPIGVRGGTAISKMLIWRFSLRVEIRREIFL